MNPYIALTRLDKPIGIWLLFFPAAWAVGLTALNDNILYLLIVMLAGAAITRAAGCIINDLTDRRLDAQVERTRTRPLASGAIQARQAIALLAALLTLALVLALSLPPRVFSLALIALPMIAAYPWMKRLTWWPQAFLGLTFNLGALFGWLAAGQPLTLPAFMLYAAGIFWTLGYDTIYAVQDMADDAVVGIRSSARALGLARLRPFVAGCYGLMLTLLAATGYALECGVAFWLGLGAAALHALWQLRALPCTPERAGVLFRSNQWVGLLIFAGILADRWVWP